jgi:type II secretory pathway pseudopilin PulG
VYEKKQKRYVYALGMSLMEVTVIVTILGVLAAIILSRLVFITDEARIASIATVRGAFVGGINGAHHQWLALSQPKTIEIEGVMLSMNNTGWPEGSSNEANGEITPEKCLEVWNAIMQNSPMAGITCTKKCVYAVTVINNPTSNRMECVYTNRQATGEQAIYYDLATGFVR